MKDGHERFEEKASQMNMKLLSANSAKAIIRGVITSLSSVKKSKKNDKVKYFNGELSDEKGCVGVISFEPSLRQPLYNSLSNKTPISVVNCEVRNAHVSGSEIVVTNCCKKKPHLRSLM